MAIGTTAAIVGGLAAGASVYSAKKNSDAINDATDAQTAAANDSAQIQREQLDYVKEINQPYQEAGVNALNQLNTLSGQEVLDQDPGYQFRLEQGQNALNSSMLAQGLGLSGSQLKAGQDYAQGSASQEYSNAFNRLYAIAGLGSGANQNAASGAATATNGISNSLIAGGQATSDGAIAQANNTNALLGNIVGIAGSTLGSSAYQNALSPTYTGTSNPVMAGNILNQGATVTYR